MPYMPYILILTSLMGRQFSVFFICLFLLLIGCVWRKVCSLEYRCPQRAEVWILLEQELQVVLSHLMWVLKVRCALNYFSLMNVVLQGLFSISSNTITALHCEQNQSAHVFWSLDLSLMLRVVPSVQAGSAGQCLWPAAFAFFGVTYNQAGDLLK